jgi:hypothetical protein
VLGDAGQALADQSLRDFADAVLLGSKKGGEIRRDAQVGYDAANYTLSTTAVKYSDVGHSRSW